MAQLCWTSYLDCWEQEVSVYVAVSTESMQEPGVHFVQAKGHEAPSLIPSSKSSR